MMAVGGWVDACTYIEDDAIAVLPVVCSDTCSCYEALLSNLVLVVV